MAKPLLCSCTGLSRLSWQGASAARWGGEEKFCSSLPLAGLSGEGLWEGGEEPSMLPADTWPADLLFLSPAYGREAY